VVERVRLRRVADEQLLEGTPPEAFPLLTWRAAQLTSDRNRRVLARSLSATAADLDARLLPGASPLNRAAARPHAGLIRMLSDRLADLDRPVSAKGVLLVHALLTDGTGPLYARSRGRDLRAALERCLIELDARRGGRSRSFHTGAPRLRVEARTRQSTAYMKPARLGSSG
jgi:hypothetical protein